MPPRRTLIRNWPGFKRIEGARVALTVGIFDGFHRGHFALFNVVREVAADFSGLPLIFTFENHPLTVLEPGRQVSYLTLANEKTHLLHRFGFEHVACYRFTKEFSLMTAEDFLSRIKENCDLRALVVGYDARIGHDRVNSDAEFQALARKVGFEFIRIEEVKAEGKPVSSRRIREAVKAGDLATANEVLVYPFFVRGRIQAGRGVGEKLLRIPTANLLVPPEKILPPEGVYAGSFRREGKHTPCALFISRASWRPKFLEKAEDVSERESSASLVENSYRVVEGHVIGRRVNLKGTTAEFILLERIRKLMEFDDPEDLRKVMLNDIQDCVRIFDKQRLRLQFLP